MSAPIVTYSPVVSRGIYLSAGLLFKIAKDAYERIPQSSSQSSGKQQEALVSLVFAAASIEAFLNELPDLTSPLTETRNQEAPAVTTFIGLAQEIESNKGSIRLKYILCFSILSGQACDKGGHPYQDFALLIEVRNSLMHMKPTEFSGEIDLEGALKFDPAQIGDKLVRKFQSKGLIDNSESSYPLPWHGTIATKAVARWACNTATHVVQTILKIIPEGPTKLAATALYGTTFVEVT